MKGNSTQFCFPTLPPTSPKDPVAILPLGIVTAYEGMLRMRDVPLDRFATCSELVRAHLLVQHWESVTALGAHLHEPYASQLAKHENGRASLVAAVRDLNGDGIYEAYRRCVEYDGLPEIEKSWLDLVAAYGLVNAEESSHG